MEPKVYVLCFYARSSMVYRNPPGSDFFYIKGGQSCETSSVVAFYSKSAWDDLSSLLMDWLSASLYL